MCHPRVNPVLRLVYALPVFMVFGLVGLIYDGYALKYCFSRLQGSDKSESATAAAKLLVFHVLLIPLLISYIRVVSTDPGGVEDSWASEAGSEEENRIRGTWCRRCQMPKPERALHCPLCGKCVLKMDHHCPWVANCVGFYNYKFFYLFVFYGFLETFFVVLTMSEGFDAAFGMDQGDIEFTIMMAYVMSLALALSLFGFVAFHTYLILVNRTTVELQSSPEDSKEYSLGCKRNWEAVLGTNKLLWFVPIRTDGVGGDGLAWSRVDELGEDEIELTVLDDNQQQVL